MITSQKNTHLARLHDVVHAAALHKRGKVNSCDCTIDSRFEQVDQVLAKEFNLFPSDMEGLFESYQAFTICEVDALFHVEDNTQFKEDFMDLL